jgi:hypothetical protein
MCPFPLSDTGWKHSSSFSSFLHFRQAQTYQKNGDRIHGIHYSQQKKNTDSSVSALLDDALNGRPQPQFNGDATARTMAAPEGSLIFNSESKVLAGRQAGGASSVQQKLQLTPPATASSDTGSTSIVPTIALDGIANMIFYFVSFCSCP